MYRVTIKGECKTQTAEYPSSSSSNWVSLQFCTLCTCSRQGYKGEGMNYSIDGVQNSSSRAANPTDYYSSDPTSPIKVKIAGQVIICKVIVLMMDYNNQCRKTTKKGFHSMILKFILQ